MNIKYTLLVFIPILFVMLLNSALAQVETGITPIPTVAVEEETSPTNPIMFSLANAFFRIRTAFTFQAERKAELLQSRLDQLGVTLQRCQLADNQQCVERIQMTIEKTQNRTERHLERKQEVLEKHRRRFEVWQQNHADRLRNRGEQLQNRLRPDQRQQNQEQLIELRSQGVKNRLDDTTNQVERKRQELQDSITE